MSYRTHLNAPPDVFFGRSIVIQAVAIGTIVGATLLEAGEYLPSSPWDKNGLGRTVMPPPPLPMDEENDHSPSLCQVVASQGSG